MSVPFVNEPKKENPYLSFIEPAVETTKALLQPWGPVEAGLNLATQTYGLPAAGLAGIAGLPFGKSEQWSLDVGKALIYEPQTAAGRKVLEATSVPFEMLGKASERVADVTRESTGRPSPSVFPWMAEAFPYGEQEPTPEERVTAGTVAGTAVMGLPLLLGARKGLSKPKVGYTKTPPGLSIGMKEDTPNPYLDLLSSERGGLGPVEQAKVASLRRQVEGISKKKESSVPQIDGLKYEGIQDLSSIKKPNQYVFTDSETGSTFSTTDLSKANLEANRDRIRAKFAEYRTPKYSIGDPVKTKDFEGVVAEISPDGSLLVGNKSGAMKQVMPKELLQIVPPALAGAGLATERALRKDKK